MTLFLRNLFIVSFLICFIVPCGNLKAQENSILKLAQALEKSGRYEESLKLYQKLFSEGNQTFLVIEGVKNSLTGLRRYDELVQFFSRLLDRYPQQINYMIELGKAYYLKGDEASAFRYWDETRRTAPDNPTVYRLVGMTLIELRLFDQAIEVYEQAIKNIDGQQSLYRDIAALYKARLEYENTVNNLLLYYTFFKQQLGYVQSQINSMTKDEEAVERIIAAIKKFLGDQYQDEGLRELLASVYITNKEYDKAFEIYGELQSRNLDQNFLHRFASEAENNKAYDYAIRAYKSILEKKINESRKINYEFNLARNYYNLGRAQSAQGQLPQAETSVQTAIGKFDQLIAGRNGVFKARSLEFKADIYRDYYNDLDQAIRLYEEALKLKINDDFIDIIRLKSGDAWLAKNDLEQAKKYYGQMSGLKYKNLGGFNLAEIDYFSGHFSTAKAGYQQLLSKLQPVDSLTNNVLDRIVFIDENRKDSLSLVKYSRAELLEKQKKESEAAGVFDALTRANTAISFKAGLKAAELYRKLEKFEKAGQILTFLVENFPDHSQIDEGLYRLGEICLAQKKYDAGLKTFQEILLSHPSSFYIEDARDKARLIGGILEESRKK